MPRLEISGLAVRYPGLETPALDIPALVLEAGEKIALSGPSGSGKTTFINVITGMERAGAGTIAWDGENIAAMSERARDRFRARNVGLIMQDFHLFAGLSAKGNVLLAQRLSRMVLPAGMDERAQQLLAHVGIERPGQNIETMSRGQMQRVAVARAVIGRPGVIVADEPTASLDREAGELVGDLLIGLARETGAMLIVATHDERLIGKLDRTVRLENGRVAAAKPVN